ncbi:EAL domain-containing protein [Nitriliruptor alkaliphilus]|uniref:EAL domain-containing protein n=1 Tax=Nitriliruptor alkaliphilus TaxID=427918 RepID=UPI0012ED2386|nr:EAL domain-containing protein [Nitriliruptor alkaliphilus]
MSAFAEEAQGAASLGAMAAAVGAAVVAYLTAERWWSTPQDALVVIPVLYATAVIGAAICAFLLAVRARILDDPVTRWTSAGFAMAGAAALAQGVVLFQPANAPLTTDPSAPAALYLLWHTALPTFIVAALVVPQRTVLRRVAMVGTLVAVGAVTWLPDLPLPELVDGAGAFTPAYRGAAAALGVLTAAAATAWLLRSGRRPTRVQAWIALALALSTLDVVLAVGADRFFAAIWWSSASARAAAFALPAAGLLADAGRSLRLLHLHERSLTDRLQTEVDHATSSLRLPVPATDAEARVRRALQPGAIRCQYQPIYSLSTGRLTAVEALARFAGPPSRPPDRWFAEAHAVGLGVELELAALTAALEGASRLPDDVPVTLNVSPGVLVRPEMIDLIAHEDRLVVVEVTEHAAVEDYQLLGEAIASLREHGARLAIDDAGAGFASMRHIVRLVPDIIKLDMTLTRDIHLDPVRRSLAASLVGFAEQIGSLLVAEGVEQAEELATWQELGAHAAQGYLLGRPADLPAAPFCEHVPVQVDLGAGPPEL